MSHILIIEARFYEDIADMLAEGAVAALEGGGATFNRVAVPGAFEIPSAVSMALSSGKYDGYVALGCVIRGETTHYDYVCAESARGLQAIAVEHQAAIGYGILTVESREQAIKRAAQDQGNKGKAAVDACLAMIALKKRLGI